MLCRLLTVSYLKTRFGEIVIGGFQVFQKYDEPNVIDVSEVIDLIYFTPFLIYT